MVSASPYTLVEIDLAALRHNYRALRQTLPPEVRLLAVVKSDAYGHGLVEAARLFAAEGAAAFGVAEVREGVLLRQAGIADDIIILLGVAPAGVAEVIHHCLQPVVFAEEQIRTLAAQAAEAGVSVGVHLKVDTGMGRLGVQPGEAPFFLDLIAKLPGVALAGVLSHFPLADREADSQTRAQLHRFLGVLEEKKHLLPAAGIRHIANSAALLHYPESRLDMVRPGIALYGCYPDHRSAGLQQPDLRPAMRFTTRVLQVKEVGAGYGVSYGHTFVTARPSRLAVLPVGYENGYLRRLSNRAQVLIKGHRAPVCGTICMNACLVDITDLPPVHPGDEVVLLGEQGTERITADELAGWLETISYEVLCLFGNQNVRAYRQAPDR